jgi:catechol 2,3-dioxygenase-like lactoylglutathione lyase family enzyme
MKRFHIHVGVENLNDSVAFYSTLFGEKPTKLKEDYAKWMLEDPRVNFAISTRSSEKGVDHLGIQVENASELSEITSRLRKSDEKIYDEGEATCCYAESNKAWVKDPSGLAWEAYETMGDAALFSEKEIAEGGECCVPDDTETKCCG